MSLSKEIRDKIKNTRLFLFDMDGTLYIGNNLFPFTKELLATIREKGGKYLFITNNSSKSVEDYVKKLSFLGIDAVTDDFLTSSMATARFLKEKIGDKILYVCGTSSLKKELEANGFTVSDDIERTECVVMGFDTELTFKKLEDVCKILLSKKDIPYVATNPDYVCPTEFGSVPDCGSVCDMIFNATKRRPVVIGKPEPTMIFLAMEKENCQKQETTVIGDRIYTDIKSGLNAGVLSLLVMSGETDEEILSSSPDKPDAVLSDCGDILEILKN